MIFHVFHDFQSLWEPCIHDLSLPDYNSVNLGIPPEYSKIDVVIDLVKQFGPGALIAKTDIEDAFHFIPINPSEYHLISFIWHEKFYFDHV